VSWSTTRVTPFELRVIRTAFVRAARVGTAERPRPNLKLWRQDFSCLIGAPLRSAIHAADKHRTNVPRTSDWMVDASAGEAAA
jgi:hypothetical protein